MAQSLAKIIVHIIFSTKNRFPFLVNADIRRRTHAYLAEVFNAYQSPAIEVGGWHDHVHILCSLSRNHAIATIVADAKRNSTNWIRTNGGLLVKFQWQAGYGAFSVSPSQLEEVRQYILSQEDHHRVKTFQEEYLELLRTHQLTYDERYLWA